AADAYGPRLDDNIIKVKREMFPAERDLRIGEKIRIEFSGGRERILVILDQDEQEVTLDGNHPLAGLDLTFALRLDAVL
ncbi:MAG: peptidylprolyl isomerase, partial [Geobacteraceae bacterium]|nr:peptidylprolyl isomerase [Geobacteraceae bacterium]